MGKERGFQFFKPARENGFAGRVLVVAAVLSVFEVRRLVQAGAAGVFLKQSPPNLLVDAIRAVMAGQLYIDPALQDYLRSDAEPRNSREALTSRDQAVLSAVVQGLANKEIAVRVRISEALLKATLQQLAPEASSSGSHCGSTAINFEVPEAPRKCEAGSWPFYVPELTVTSERNHRRMLYYRQPERSRLRRIKPK